MCLNIKVFLTFYNCNCDCIDHICLQFVAISTNVSSSLLLPRHPRPTQGTLHQRLRRLPCRRKAALFRRPCLARASLPMAPCTPQPLRHSHFQALVQHHLLDLRCLCHYLHGNLSITFQFLFFFFKVFIFSF